MKDLTIHNAKEHCRTCLIRTTNSENTYAESEKCNKYYIPSNQQLEFLLNKYMNSVEHEDVNKKDGYPQYLCIKCFQVLENFECLHKKALDSASKLFDIFCNKNTNNECIDGAGENILYENEVDDLIEPDGDMEDSRWSTKFETRNDYSKALNHHKVESEVYFNEDPIHTSDAVLQENAINCKQKLKNLSKIDKTKNFKTKKIETEVQFKSVRDKSGKILKILVKDTPSSVDAALMKMPQGEPDKKLYCEICNRNFSTYTRFIRHKYALHMDNRKLSRYICPNCSRIFKTQVLLEIHYKSIHAPVQEIQHLCDTCGFLAANKSSLNRHVTNRHTHATYFKCGQCPKQFKHKKSLSDHEVIHQNLKPFKCNQCDRAFTYRNSLKKHKASHMPYDERLKCDYEECKIRFTDEADKRRHLRAVHWKIKDHKCDNCEKSFGSKQLLKRHSYIHTGEKPNKCSECELSFTHCKSLYLHRKTYHV